METIYLLTRARARVCVKRIQLREEARISIYEANSIPRLVSQRRPVDGSVSTYFSLARCHPGTERSLSSDCAFLSPSPSLPVSFSHKEEALSKYEYFHFKRNVTDLIEIRFSLPRSSIAVSRGVESIDRNRRGRNHPWRIWRGSKLSDFR